MSNSRFSKMVVENLVSLHADLSAKQGHAQESFLSMTIVNRLGKQIFDINDELKSRPGDQRIVLIKLFSNPDPWVRFNAASAVLDIATASARPIIQAIADSKNYPVAAHAGMCLSLFDGELSHLRVR